MFYQGGAYTTTAAAGPVAHSQLNLSRGQGMGYYGGVPLHHGYQGVGLEMMGDPGFMMSRELADQQVPSGREHDGEKCM